MANENKNYKDSVFTDLFYSDKDAAENLLSLYNALYGTSYTDPGIVCKIRLEDVMFKNFKNDIAFTVNNRRIILGEHQSTINYNMPLRNLMYFGREMEKMVPAEDRLLMVEYDYDTDMKVQRKEAMEEGIKTGIAALVSACQDFGKSRSETRDCLLRKYSFSQKEADAYIDEFWK